MTTANAIFGWENKFSSCHAKDFVPRWTLIYSGCLLSFYRVHFVDLNQDGFEYVKNIAGDSITAYLWTADNTKDDILSGTGDYKYMVRLGTSTYNEATLVNERTFFYRILQPLMCQPTPTASM